MNSGRTKPRWPNRMGTLMRRSSIDFMSPASSLERDSPDNAAQMKVDTMPDAPPPPVVLKAIIPVSASESPIEVATTQPVGPLGKPSPGNPKLDVESEIPEPKRPARLGTVMRRSSVVYMNRTSSPERASSDNVSTVGPKVDTTPHDPPPPAVPEAVVPPPTGEPPIEVAVTQHVGPLEDPSPSSSRLDVSSGNPRLTRAGRMGTVVRRSSTLFDKDHASSRERDSSDDTSITKLKAAHTTSDAPSPLTVPKAVVAATQPVGLSMGDSSPRNPKMDVRNGRAESNQAVRPSAMARKSAKPNVLSPPTFTAPKSTVSSPTRQAPTGKAAVTRLAGLLGDPPSRNPKPDMRGRNSKPKQDARIGSAALPDVNHSKPIAPSPERNPSNSASNTELKVDTTPGVQFAPILHGAVVPPPTGEPPIEVVVTQHIGPLEDPSPSSLKPDVSSGNPKPRWTSRMGTIARRSSTLFHKDPPPDEHGYSDNAPVTKQEIATPPDVLSPPAVPKAIIPSLTNKSPAGRAAATEPAGPSPSAPTSGDHELAQGSLPKASEIGRLKDSDYSGASDINSGSAWGVSGFGLGMNINPFSGRASTDSTQNPSLRDPGKPSPEQPRVIGKVNELMGSILGNKLAYKTLLGSKGEKAQTALDIMQKILDNKDTPEDLKTPVLYAVMRLCRFSGAYPQCLTLRGIRCDEQQPIASGHFGEIWRGYFEGHPVAIKVSKSTQKVKTDHLAKSFSREAILWKSFTHPNLQPFYGIYRLENAYDRVCLVSPWEENGNISEYLEANPDVARFPLVFDILAGLGYLHQHKVVHGDLKAANILISSTGSACLADFGLSSVVDTEILRWTSLETMTQTGGTIRWEAPELMDEMEDGSVPKPTPSSDVYSMASVMYEVLTGQIPYYEFPRDTTVLSKIIKGIIPTKPPMNSALELSDGIWGVMQSCWSLDPGERPTVDQAAGVLQQLPRPTLTEQRIARSHTRPNHSVSTPLAPQDFRAAVRGHSNDGFSQEEFQFLQEYIVSLR